MKKITLGLCLLVAASSWAQDKYAPVIKQGTKLVYSAYVNSQTFPCTFSLDSVGAGYLKVGWNVEGFGTGSWIMKNKSLESGLKGFWGQPNPGTRKSLAMTRSFSFSQKRSGSNYKRIKNLISINRALLLKAPPNNSN